MRKQWGAVAFAAFLMVGAAARAETDSVVTEIVAGCNDARWFFEELDLTVASLAADVLAEVTAPASASAEAAAVPAALAPEHFAEGPEGETLSLIARDLAALGEATGSIDRHAELGEASSSAQAGPVGETTALASAGADDAPVLP